STLHPPSSTLFPYTTLFRSGLRPGELEDGLPLLRRLLAPGAGELLGLGELEAGPAGHARLRHLRRNVRQRTVGVEGGQVPAPVRSEEHTSELQSRFDLVCRL